MTEVKKEGFFQRLFGGKKPACCGVEIEEITEEESEEEVTSESQSESYKPDSKS
jgi:hypothetical protein